MTWLCHLRRVSAAFVIVVLSASSGYPQSESAVSGLVTDTNGQSISDVIVYGSLSKECCPFRRETVKTNEKGQFRLEHPGAVIHFLKEHFRPQSTIIQRQRTELRVVLKPESEVVVPSCRKKQAHESQVGWRRLQFFVQKHGLKLLGGKPDVDYVRYLIRPTSGEGFLELWFGPYAMSSDPDDDLFLASQSFEQRDLALADGTVIGIESRGRFRNGNLWRQTAVFIEGGARYRDARPATARLFDQVIDSACELSYPR